MVIVFYQLFARMVKMLQFLPFFLKRVSCWAPSKHGGRASALYPSTGLRVTARFF